MKTLIVIGAALLMSACTTLPSTGKVDLKMVDGFTASPYSQIKTSLSREFLRFGYWDVIAYPYTLPLIQAEEREIAQKNSDSPEKTEKAIKAMSDSLLSKTCFMVHLRSRESLGKRGAQFKYWSAQLEDASGKSYDLTFSNLSGDGAIADMHHGWWFNNSIACTSEKVPMNQTLKVHVTPNFKGDFVKDSKATLVWEVAQNDSRN